MKVLQGYIDNQLGYLAANKNASAPHARAADWRTIERLLIEYCRSHRIHIIDAAGANMVEVIRCWEGDEAFTVALSLEALAQFLAQNSPR